MQRPPKTKREYRDMCVTVCKRLNKHLKQVEQGSNKWGQILRLGAELDQIVARLDRELGKR